VLELGLIELASQVAEEDPHRPPIVQSRQSSSFKVCGWLGNCTSEEVA